MTNSDWFAVLAYWGAIGGAVYGAMLLRGLEGAQLDRECGPTPGPSYLDELSVHRNAKRPSRRQRSTDD